MGYSGASLSGSGLPALPAAGAMQQQGAAAAAAGGIEVHALPLCSLGRHLLLATVQKVWEEAYGKVWTGVACRQRISAGRGRLACCRDSHALARD